MYITYQNLKFKNTL